MNITTAAIITCHDNQVDNSVVIVANYIHGPSPDGGVFVIHGIHKGKNLYEAAKEEWLKQIQKIHPSMTKEKLQSDKKAQSTFTWGGEGTNEGHWGFHTVQICY